jgi:hypothetical protein
MKMIYYDKQDYDNVLIYLKKGLNILLLLNHPSLVITYFNLIQVYDKQNNDEMIALYYKKLLEFQKTSKQTNL